MAELSLTTLLQQRANRRPGGTAYTFIDYDVDPAGVAESLTWPSSNVVRMSLLKS